MTDTTQVPLHDIYKPAPEDRCEATANLKGEHVQCELRREHQGWAHSNGEHELIWAGGAFA